MLFSRIPTRREVAFSTLLATLTAAAVLLPLLGHKPLAEWDEGIYAEVAREMLGGSWLVPHWNGRVWFEKPPLMFWITAIFFKLFGVSEFWARAGSAFSGVAIVALLHSWLARGKDLLTAWLSSIILLVTLGFLHVCHVGEMDVLLSLGCVIALIGLSQIQHQSTNPRGWLFFWLGFAIAVMTKGAASVILPVTAVLLAMSQRWRRLGAAFWLGLLLFALLVVPWHMALYRRGGSGFVDEYLGLHVLTRATQQIEGHRTPWWFYLKVLLVSAPPFCLLYPVSVWRGFRRADVRVWAIFAVVVVGCFTLVQTRLPHYIAPAYPALAVLIAGWAGNWIRAHSGRGRSFWMQVAGATCVVWIASIVLTHTALKRLHSAQREDGKTLADNREADALVGASRREFAGTDGPLLLWRSAPVQSVATVMFYAQRQVEQVELEPLANGAARDRYMFDPIPLRKAVGDKQRLILLDRSLVSLIPESFLFSPVHSSATLVLGNIARGPR